MIIRSRTVFIFLFLAGLLAYLNSLNVPFHYDDFYYLKENLSIKSFKIFREWFVKDPAAVFTGRPFLLLTFFLNYKLGGLDTFGYHFLNMLLHVINSFLLYLILFRYADATFAKGGWVEAEKENELASKKRYSFKYILAAVIFLIHPVNTESVTYISSRSSVLSGFFVLASMLSFFRAAEKKFHFWYYISGIAFFVLGLSTKQIAIVLFPVLILFDYFFISKGLKNLKSRFKYYLPYFLLIGFLLMVYSRYISMPEVERPWLIHILTELKVIVLYLKLLIIPIGLNIDHDVKPSAFIDAYVGLSLLVIFILLFSAVFLKRKNPVISFSILWFFINMLPFFALRLNDFMTERWVYIASIGFSIALSEILLLSANYYRRAGIALTTAIIILFGALTVMRNQAYASQVSLWEDAARKSPDKYRPYLNLSRAYIERGDLPKAIESAQEGIKRGGTVVEVYINLSVAYKDRGEYEKAEEVLKAIEKDAANYYAYHYNLGAVYTNTRNYEKALLAFMRAIEIYPDSSLILFAIGETYQSLSQEEKAKEYFILATQKIPQNAQDYMGQGVSFFKLGDGKKALESFYEAVKADPLDVNVRIYLANTLLGNGYPDKAFKQYLIAAKISPNHTPAYTGMGSAMLSKGNSEEARKHFNKALSLLPPDSPERKELLELLDKAQ